MIRMVSCDLDGTLFDAPVHVAPGTFEGIRMLDGLGVRVAICTGRRAVEALDMFEPVVGLLDIVAACGAEIVCRGEWVRRMSYEPEALERLRSTVAAMEGVHLVIHGPEIAHVISDTPEKFAQMSNPRHLIRPYAPEPLPADFSPNNGFIFVDDEERVPQVVELLERKLGDAFAFAWTGGTGVDFVPYSWSKTEALAALLHIRGVDPADVVAYGDSMNDYDVLASVGHPVVVGNALPDVRTVAERIIEPNTERGVLRDWERIADDLRAGGTGEIRFGMQRRG